MTFWRILTPTAIGAVVLVGGVTLVLGAAWLLARLARRYGTDPTPMGTTTITQPVRSKEEAEAIRAAADVRRDRADAKRSEGRAIDSGEPARTIKLTGTHGR